MQKHLKSLLIFIFSFTLFLTQSCDEINKKDPLKIAISKDIPAKYITTYSGWISRFQEDVEFYNLYPMGIDSAIRILKDCDGLILTGGADIFPAYYNKINDTTRCGKFDHYRDSLEFASINTALEMRMPIVGICRGEQILNISQGGSLIINIPTDFDSSIRHRNDGMEYCFHDINCVDQSLLSNICGIKHGDVISNHHQGIDKQGKGLKISAYSKDHLPEAIEWEHRGEKSFLLAVQWHPERMDTLHPLSAPIAKEFLREMKIFQEEELERKITSQY
jgi:putative glutamine amidotransferase